MKSTSRHPRLLDASWNTIKQFSLRFSQSHKRSRAKRYLFPILIIPITFALQVSLAGVLGVQTPFLLLTFIIVLSAWFGGLGPGVLATIMTAILADFFLLVPRFAFDGLDGLIAMAIFILQGIIISMVSEAKRQADLQKDEFIGFASHELKNPLSVLLGYHGILQKTAETTKDKKLQLYMSKSKAALTILQKLINELLDISKIESGNLPIQKEKFPIYPLLTEVVQDQRLITQTHKIILQGRSKRSVYSDRYRINQVITNMISNAVKYSHGKKKIIVALRDVRRGVVISVHDFGPGIAEKEQQKIFDKFYRVTGSKASGLGLGLYLSRKIAELSNGKMWVMSEEGKGSTFFLQLPTVR